MRVFIPAGSDEPIDLDLDLEHLLDGIRLSELEALDDILDAGTMAGLLSGEMTLAVMRPVLWLRLRRDYPELEQDGFDVEILPAGEEDPGSGKG